MATARTFDARPDRLDLRDLPYRAPLRSLPPRYPLDSEVQQFIPSYVAGGLVLDQGSEGACTGFGLACVANYLFWVRHVQDGQRTPFLPVSPRMLYELARRYDEWPGTEYEGSSCRGALKGWHKHGVCSFDAWPYRTNAAGKAVFVRPSQNWELDAAQRPLGVYYRVDRESIVDLQAAIADIGAVYVSASVHDGWDALAGSTSAAPNSHAALPEIAPLKDPKSRGGHAFALVGYNERGFVVQNSWGTTWGASGFAVLPYDDWIVNATDAWACGLGVPAVVRDGAGRKTRPIAASSWRMASGTSLTALDRQTRQPRNPADDPWPIDHAFNFTDYEPWSTAAAYEHSLVTGNNGELAPTDFTRDPRDRRGLARQIVVEAPQMWLASRSENVLRLAVYAHGGLNSEQESIERIRVLGPCFEANGIYPIFLTWKTGPGETIGDMVQDWAARWLGEEAARSKGILEALGDAKDRAVEAAAHTFFRGLWTEMRENAAAAVAPDHGLDLLLKSLLALQGELAAAGKRLDLHIAGHSAGSILLGHFLSLAAGASTGGTPALTVTTSTLFAAACSCAFANRHYGAAQAKGVLDLSKLWLYVLDDQNEKADGLPTPAVPAYGKSLLYLVSRALDDARKMPLLGMQRAQLASYAGDADQWSEAQLSEVQQWQSAWPGAAQSLLRVVDTPQVQVTREGGQIKASHGSFDNNIAVLTETIERIKGAPLAAPLEWLDY
ncbi:C1 family peptidase [Ramlibacter sp.]|uniref:C1 family peptidase n=1 Tax=Ramlibacter sp. TaxID=1917967 RepID=UPI002C5946B5|nr:C1 family peptidase [Ramlibacter sp.]HWI82633.1 C1 family peptidase [Ramlibacter sp.]